MPDEPLLDVEPKKKRHRRKYPRPVTIMDLMGNPVSRKHPLCIFKMMPPKMTCKYRLQSGRCHKRVNWGFYKFQLTDKGDCPCRRPIIKKKEEPEP